MTTKTAEPISTPLSSMPEDQPAFCWQIRLPKTGWCGADPEDRWSINREAVQAITKHSLYPCRIVEAAPFTGELFYGPVQGNLRKLR